MWWKVDFGGKYSIYSIYILFKNYDSFGMYVNVNKSFDVLFNNIIW